MSGIDYTKKRVARDYITWTKDNPGGTLGQFLARLQESLDQCMEMAFLTNDARIEDCWDEIPEPLRSQLAERDNTDEECTFSYREENIEVHYWDVKELVKELGEDFKAADLAK
jgi:hypothetical protein